MSFHSVYIGVFLSIAVSPHATFHSLQGERVVGLYIYINFAFSLAAAASLPLPLRRGASRTKCMRALYILVRSLKMRKSMYMCDGLFRLCMCICGAHERGEKRHEAGSTCSNENPSSWPPLSQCQTHTHTTQGYILRAQDPRLPLSLC